MDDEIHSRYFKVLMSSFTQLLMSFINNAVDSPKKYGTCTELWRKKDAAGLNGGPKPKPRFFSDPAVSNSGRSLSCRPLF